MTVKSTSNAYSTLVTNPDYVMGAMALINSLLHTGTKADIVVMHTGALSEEQLAPLKARGAILKHVELLPTSDEFNLRHARNTLHKDAPFLKGGKPTFHTPLDNFAKLRLWQMSEYETIVFLDADTIALHNIDRLFDYPEFSAAPNVYETMADFHRLNSGVFVAKPSKDTFASMLNILDQPNKFWRRTDQTFLEGYFPNWQGLPVFDNMLQYVWFNMPELWKWEAINVLHFQYEKPWQKTHDKSDKLAPLIELWQAFYNNENIPDIDNLPPPTKE